MENAKIPEITINTFEELKKYIEDNELIKTKRSDIPDDINIITNPVDLGIRFFRGVENSGYDLSSTLERYIRKYYNKDTISSAEFESISKDFLTDCKITLKSKIPEKYILLDEKYENEIWFYGQHYGLSTPFLDWTRSFWVALYFAFENYRSETKYRAIYFLNRFMMDEHIKIYEAKIDLGGRLTAQKGVFTKMLSKDFENINDKAPISPVDGKKYDVLTKILINSNLRKEVLEYLLSINIDCTTIYPDMLGAIKNSHLALNNILETRILE